MTRTASARTKAADGAGNGTQALKIVAPDDGDGKARAPDLGALETALTEFASVERPAILRADLARQKAAQAVREIESEIGDLDARLALLERAYEAARLAMTAQRDDLTGTLAIHQHGLVGASTGRNGEAQER